MFRSLKLLLKMTMIFVFYLPLNGNTKEVIDCQAFYDLLPNYSAEAIARGIDLKIQENPHSNHSLLIYDFIEQRFAAFSEMYLSKVKELQKLGTDNQVESSTSLTIKLSQTIITHIKDIEVLIKKNALHSEKAKGITEALKTCSKSMGECELRLRTGVDQAQVSLNETRLLKDKIRLLSNELGRVSHPTAFQVLENKQAQFSIILATLEKLETLINIQIDTAVNALLSFPVLKHQLLDLEVSGVDIGEFARQKKTIHDEPLIVKHRSAVEFYRIAELNALVAKYPASAGFKKGLKKMNEFSPQFLSENFHSLILEHLSEVKSDSTFIGYESEGPFERPQITMSNLNRKNIHLKGFTISEVKSLLDLALSFYFEHDLAQSKDGQFVYINSKEAALEIGAARFDLRQTNRMISTSLDSGLPALLWSLMSRLEHALHKDDLDLMVDYLLFRLDEAKQAYAPIKEQAIAKVWEEHNSLLNRLESDFDKKVAGYRFYYLKKRKVLDYQNYLDERVVVRNRANEKIDALNGSRDPKFGRVNSLESIMRELPNIKSNFFRLLVIGTDYEKSVYTNGRVTYDLTKIL